MAWQHGTRVVTLARLGQRGRLRRVDAPEGMIFGSFLRVLVGAERRLRMVNRNRRMRSLEGDGFGHWWKVLWVGFGQSVEEGARNRKLGGPHDW